MDSSNFPPDVRNGHFDASPHPTDAFGPIPHIVPLGMEYCSGPQPDEMSDGLHCSSEPVTDQPETGRVEDRTHMPIEVGTRALDAASMRVAEAAARVELLETRGYVEEAPDFKTQAEDQSRQNLVTALQGIDVRPATPRELVTVTEHEAVKDLYQFLEVRDDDLRAAYMLEHMTVIGDEEVQAGAKTFSDYWGNYLEADERHQLCLVAPKGDRGEHKSPSYVLDKALGHIGDDKLEAYARGGRIILSPALLTAAPDDAKIVTVDDLAATGTRLRQDLVHLFQYLPPEYRSSVEANLVVSAKQYLEAGIAPRHSTDVVPVKAHYRAHDAPRSQTGRVHIATTHSTPAAGLAKEVLMLGIRHWLVSRRPILADVRQPYAVPGWRPENIERLARHIARHR